MPNYELINRLLKVSGNPLATLAEKGILGDVKGYTDTGSYSLNALLSGSIYKGFATNKILGLAGEEATGKTFYGLSIILNWLKANPDGLVVVFETEGATTCDMLDSRGIDRSRYLNFPVATIEDFRSQALNILIEYEKDKNRVPLFLVLDSLGNISTKKEIGDISEFKDTRDMTRTPLIKGAFRALTLRLTALDVPMLVTNHTYQGQGMFATKEMSGGSGLKYAASIIVFLNKSQAKIGEERVGSIIKVKLDKSRLTREGAVVETRLLFSEGLDRYYGLLPMAVRFGIVKKTPKYVFPRFEEQGIKPVFETEVNRNPEKYFTKEVLDMIDQACQVEFKLGSTSTNFLESELIDGEEETTPAA
jgi:RecA/RadA recombinase